MFYFYCLYNYFVYENRTSKYDFCRWISVLLMYQRRYRNSIWFVHSPRNCYFLNIPSKLRFLYRRYYNKVFRNDRRELFDFYPTLIFYDIFIYIFSFAFFFHVQVLILISFVPLLTKLDIKLLL